MKIENTEKPLPTMKTIYYLIVTVTFYDFILQKHPNSFFKGEMSDLFISFLSAIY